ncbi:unnamed protein product [Caenorhabditis nigoni]
MQQDPQNDRYYHNQLYPEAQKENHSMNNDVEQLSNNGRVDQQRDHQNNHIQRQRNRYHQLHPHYGPYLQIQENAQQHLTQQNQQRIHEHATGEWPATSSESAKPAAEDSKFRVQLAHSRQVEWKQFSKGKGFRREGSMRFGLRKWINAEPI